MKNDREVAVQPVKSGITRRGLVNIMKGVGAGIGAAVIAGKATTVAFAQQVKDAVGSVLPFPAVPTASTAGPTLQESKHARRAEPNHLPPDEPNILIVLLDDVGFGLADTLGGEVHTPTLTRLANDGVAFNQFHTTSICSPTRAALLTGRNHQRVGSGTIAERALDFDGYTGVIPKKRGDSRAGAARLRLQDLGVRQVAQHAGDGNDRDGSVRTVADGLWLRLFLRVHGGRDFAIRATPVREHHSDRAAARRDLSLEFRHGGQGADVASQAPRLRARQALPDVLGAGRRAWAASRLQGMGGQVQGQVRYRLGRLSRARLQTAREHRLDSAGHETHAARRHDGFVGQHPGVAAPVPDEIDGDFRRLRRTCRTHRSGGSSMASKR